MLDPAAWVRETVFGEHVVVDVCRGGAQPAHGAQQREHRGDGKVISAGALRGRAAR